MRGAYHPDHHEDDEHDQEDDKVYWKIALRKKGMAIFPIWQFASDNFNILSSN